MSGGVRFEAEPADGGVGGVTEEEGGKQAQQGRHAGQATSIIIINRAEKDIDGDI